MRASSKSKKAAETAATKPVAKEQIVYPVALKANGGPKAPPDDPTSKRPKATIKGVPVFFKDDDITGLPERECVKAGGTHDAHDWFSALLNEDAWCYGTGHSPTTYAGSSTYVTKKMTDYSVNWRDEYVTPITVAEARKIAYDMHKDQKDKSNESYHFHLEGVRQGVVVLGGNTEMEIAALFHDAVEDHHTTYEMLAKIGCTPYTVEIVRVMNKGTQTQEEFLAAIIASAETLKKLAPDTDPDGEGAMIVSLADTMHNTRRDRMRKVAKVKSEYERARLLKKYRPRMARLMLELGIIATEDDQKLLDKVATKPVGTGGGTYSAVSTDNSVRYKGDNLAKNEWPAGWPSPIKEKKTGFVNVYVLWDGSEHTAYDDMYYKLWTKYGVEQQAKAAKKGKDWTPAKETEDYTKTSYGTSGTTTSTSKAQTTGKPYDIDQLFRGDWVTFWKAPILTQLWKTDKKVCYLLANGEIKEEDLKFGGSIHAKVRTVTVWTQQVWENDPNVNPYGVTEDDILDYINAVNRPYKGVTRGDTETLDADVLNDVDKAIGGFLKNEDEPNAKDTWVHDDDRECVYEYGGWWYHPLTDSGALMLGSFTECMRAHGEAGDVIALEPPDEPYVPLCGNMAAHDRHDHFVLAGEGSASMMAAECEGMHEIDGTAKPTCLDTEPHAAHYMPFGPQFLARIFCKGVGTATANAQPRVCADKEPHGVHWVEDTAPDGVLRDWRCAGVAKPKKSPVKKPTGGSMVAKTTEQEYDAGLG